MTLFVFVPWSPDWTCFWWEWAVESKATREWLETESVGLIFQSPTRILDRQTARTTLLYELVNLIQLASLNVCCSKDEWRFSLVGTHPHDNLGIGTDLLAYNRS